MPSQIQDLETAQALTERFGLIGKLPLLLDGTIVPVAVVGELEDRRFRHAAGLLNTAGVAAQFGYVQLFNPAGSGVLVTLNRFWANIGAAMGVEFGFVDAAMTAVTSTEIGWTDRRVAGGPAAIIHGRTSAGALLDLKLGELEMDPTLTVTRFVPFEAILLEGEGFGWKGDTLNVRLQLNVDWSERALLPSE